MSHCKVLLSTMNIWSRLEHAQVYFFDISNTGKILVYDVRVKNVLHSIDSVNEGIVQMVFQPPKVF